MQSSDRNRFRTALAAVGMTFGVEIGKDLARGYWMALEDLPIERVEAAMAQALRRSQWMPKPFEIRKLAGESPVVERVAGAWEEVLRLASNCRAAKHSDPVAEAAIRSMGGWLSIGGRDSAEFEIWGRKQFEELYGILAESAETRAALGEADPPKLSDLDDQTRALVSKLAKRM